MKNKRILCKVFLLCSILCCVMLFSFTASAEESADISGEIYEKGIENLMESVDDDVYDILKSLGVEEFSPEDFINIGLDDSFKLVFDIFRGSLTEPLKCLCSLLGVVIMTAAAGSFIDEKGSFKIYFDSVTVLFSGLLAFSMAEQCIKSVASSLYSVGTALKALIPIMAAVTAYSGNPALAVSYNAVALYSAEIINALCQDFLTPVLCMVAAVSVCGSVNVSADFSPLLSGAKKIINIILGLCGTVFTGILTVKDVLAASVDKVSVKSLKFLLGSAVPIVGGSVSEGFSSVLASVSLMKNTYGMLGIIIIGVMVFPALCQLILWMAAFILASYAASSLGQSKTASVISSLQFVLSMLLSVLIFITYISVISTAMVILMAGK